MTQLREIMTPGLVSVSPDATLQETASLMRDQDVGLVAIAGDEGIHGVVTDRDIVVRGLASGAALDSPVRSIMSGDVLVCNDSDSVQDAARLMQDRQVRRLIVVNGERSPVGVISLGDLSQMPGEDESAKQTLEAVSQDRNAS